MDTGAEQTAGMHGNGMVVQADTVQGLAVSAARVRSASTYRSRVARTWPRLPDYGMTTNFDSKQQRSGLTNALTSRRREQTKDQPLRSVPNTDHGDSHTVPRSSHALFVIPSGRGDGFRASIRGHVLDLAEPSSGHALAPTPDDLFIVSIASELAWSAQRFLRAYGLPDDVSVSATWRTREDLPSPADIDLTVTVSRRAEAVGAVLAAALANSLTARSPAESVVHISLEGVNR